jgi:hypothetical protein
MVFMVPNQNLSSLAVDILDQILGSQETKEGTVLQGRVLTLDRTVTRRNTVVTCPKLRFVPDYETFGVSGFGHVRLLRRRVNCGVSRPVGFR